MKLFTSAAVIAVVAILVLVSQGAAQSLNAPGNLVQQRISNKNQVSWTDLSTGEVSYEIGRSTGDGVYITIAVLPANSTLYNDAAINLSLTYYYRVKTIGSNTESEFSYQQPLTPVAISCGQSMCFPEDCISPTPSSTVIKTIQIPDCPSCVLDITFTRFDTEQSYDILTVYDGNSITAPVLGVFSGNQIPPEIAANGRSITLAYRPDFFDLGLGWELIPTCIERPSKPELLASREIYSSEVTIQWADNSSNETGFEIDRSTSPIFETYTTFNVPPNTSEFQATNLDSLTTYYFRTRSIFGKVKSFNSNILTVTTDQKPFRDSALSFLTPENLNGVVKMSDMNNDKLYDLVVLQSLASDSRFHVKVYSNSGNQQFALRKDYTASSIINEIKIADMDNDRDLDIISSELEVVNLLVNNGNDFTPQLAFKLPRFSTNGFGMLTGDYDSDGDMDVFVHDKSSAFAGWYRNNANYEFSFDSLSFLNKRFLEVQTADLDNNGRLDLIVTEEVSSSPENHIYFNQGGRYQHMDYPELSPGWYKLLPVDIDSDGDLDLVLNLSGGLRVAINTTGIFTLAEPVFGIPGVLLLNGTAGDMDNDGDIDLIFEQLTNGAFVLINKGNYTFSMITNFVFEQNTADKLVETIDWDNDADLDIIMIDKSSRVGTVWNNVMSKPNQGPQTPGQLSAVSNGSAVKLQWTGAADDKTPTSGLRYNIFIGKTITGEEVRTADSHKDNGQLKRFDIHYISNHYIDIKNLADGDYFWGVQSLDGAQMPSLFATSTFTVTASDFIKAPKNFVASAWSPYDNDLHWVDDSSNEQGFIVMRSLTYEKGYTLIATLPANSTSFRDSGLDTFTAYYYRIAAVKGAVKSELSPIVVCQTLPLFSTTYSKFVTTPEVKRTFGGEMQWVDLNNDNRRDFIVVGEGFNGFNYVGMIETYVQREDDPWHFDKFIITVNSDNPFLQVNRISSVSSGDFDNDGDIDLLLGRTVSLSAVYNAQVVVLENTGNYIFNTMVIDGLRASTMNAVRWGDFDNDGDLDILASTQDDFTHVYKNDGNHIFTDYFSAILGGWAEWIDFNNDGMLDVVVSSKSFINGTDANFYSYRNTGAGFQLRDSFFTLYGKIKIADPDNDGDEDILTVGPVGAFTGFLENDRNTNAFVIRDLGLPQASGPNFAWIDFDNDNYTDILRNQKNSTSLALYQNKHGLHFGDQAYFPTAIIPEVSITDIDRDSNLDVVCFEVAANLTMLVFENSSQVIKLKPSPPTSLSIEQKSDTTILKWITTGTNLNQTFNVMVGTGPGKQDIINSLSDAETGFRKINEVGNTRYVNHKTIIGLKEGTYFWSVQAIDQNYQGSAFAKVGSFVIGSPSLPAPEIISATALSSKKIEVRFANPNSEAERILYVSHDGIQFTLLNSVSTNQYVHSGLESGNTYYYRMVLFDGTHYSTYSNTIQATTFFIPEITGVVAPIQSNEDQPFSISLSALSVSHASGYPDQYKLLIGTGNNYDVNSDQTIQPSLNFNGTLTVPIRIANQSDTSDVHPITITVHPVNDSPSSFSLQSPSNESEIDNDDLISFEWEEATDVDGDPLTYTVLITLEGNTLTFDNINTPHFELDFTNFPAFWNNEVQWKVVANDAGSETNSSEIFSFAFIHVVTALEELNHNEYIYPNPAEAYLVVNNPNHNIYMCSIHDTKGMQVALVQTNQKSDGLVIDVSSLTPGMYIIKVLTLTNEKRKVNRFVKK